MCWRIGKPDYVIEPKPQLLGKREIKNKCLVVSSVFFAKNTHGGQTTTLVLQLVICRDFVLHELPNNHRFGRRNVNTPNSLDSGLK